MEAAAPPVTTGSKTMADLFGRAAQLHGDGAFARHKVADEWQDVNYAQAWEIVREIGLGLIDLGVQGGDRVCILANTRPEWSFADFGATAAGAVVVPIYQTNSPKECEWVAGNSEAVAVICEDAEQVAKIVAVRENLPDLRHIVVIDPAGTDADAGAIALDDLRERGRARDAGDLQARIDAVKPEDAFTFIYTSGTTGPPKGCVLTHGNYRAMLDMCTSLSVLRGGEEADVVYLFLPLAHSFALLIQLLTVDLGGTIAYFGGDTRQIIPEIAQVKPTYLPSVPRIFEKLYTLAQTQLPAEEIELIRTVGGRIRDLEVAGQEVPQELSDQFEPVAAKAEFVRTLFGGRLRQAVTGAAPIAREILEFFWGAGVPVLEGYGMTETATAATYSTIEEHKFGTVGRPFPGCEVRIADDGELLVKGPNIFKGYYKMQDASFGAIDAEGWMHTGDLGSIDSDGYVSITGRKKDIIITAGGKNLTPANIENDMKQSRWISQAVMHGDRRPFPVMLVTLDEEEIVPWAQAEGIEDTSIAALSRDPKVLALVQAELDRANSHYAQVEQVKKFFVLDHDLSQETGELTPTLKVKRNVVNDKYADRFESLYGGSGG
jgi:long-chain acyl-CoA synthetase